MTTPRWHADTCRPCKLEKEIVPIEGGHFAVFIHSDESHTARDACGNACRMTRRKEIWITIISRNARPLVRRDCRNTGLQFVSRIESDEIWMGGNSCVHLNAER